MKGLTLAGIAGIPLLAITGTTSAVADLPQETVAEITYTSASILKEDTVLTTLELEVRQAELRAELKEKAEQRQVAVAEAYEVQLLENGIAVEDVITDLLDRVGRTPYVFAGSTPYGWDCSGMVLWAYEQLGINLPHSASKQSELGMSVTAPQLGDTVFFNAGSGVYHAAIYLGDNKVIHSGFKPGRKTEIISLDSPAFSGNVITYKRFIDLGN